MHLGLFFGNIQICEFAGQLDGGLVISLRCTNLITKAAEMVRSIIAGYPGILCYFACADERLCSLSICTGRRGGCSNSLRRCK
jgi:hypothetical protein